MFRAETLHREILAFTISHDHSTVKIYGHYAFLTEGGKTTFHRYLIRHYAIRDQDGKERWTAYNFVRNVYEHFAPSHLRRIKDAISQLREPNSGSSMPINSNEAKSQEIPASAPSSQDTAIFKRPALPAKPKRSKASSGNDSEALRILQQELERRRQELERQRQESERQRQEMRQELERQRQESEQQRQEMREEMKQREVQLMRFLEQQREEAKQAREESKQRETQVMQLLEEQHKWMEASKQSR